MKFTPSITIMLFTSVCNLLAQNTKVDSVAIKTALATSDAKYFIVDKEVRKAYRKHQLTNTSDYLKPSGIKIPNSNLSTDSIYLKSFKNVAYRYAVKRIKLNRTIIICTIIAGVVATPLAVSKGLKSLLSNARPTM